MLCWFSRAKVPFQREKAQVHSAPEAEPKHGLPQPGHEVPAAHPSQLTIDPLSSALFSITSEYTLRGWATASSSQIPWQSQEGGGRYWVLLQKAWLGCTSLFQRQGEKSTTEGALPEAAQPGQVRGTKELTEEEAQMGLACHSAEPFAKWINL